MKCIKILKVVVYINFTLGIVLFTFGIFQCEQVYQSIDAIGAVVNRTVDWYSVKGGVYLLTKSLLLSINIRGLSNYFKSLVFCLLSDYIFIFFWLIYCSDVIQFNDIEMGHSHNIGLDMIQGLSHLVMVTNLPLCLYFTYLIKKNRKLIWQEDILDVEE